MELKLEDHLLADRLTYKDKKIVVDLTKSLVEFEHILMNLNDSQKDNLTNIKVEKSEMQQLLKCMEDNKYVYKCRSKYDSTIDQYIYWAHPKSIKLFNTFSTVLIIDSTPSELCMQYPKVIVTDKDITLMNDVESNEVIPILMDSEDEEEEEFEEDEYKEISLDTGVITILGYQVII
ncbi:hypothetical protein MTR_1g071020 [Medicago truncatula]|uniref:Uncharacterized protein n=1 Tax=Medicago truncatula TaxID=3880 RepID=G7ICP2_MEDTR|nr:hypothetical protein MTR_1g071020 [Medicago truncatula]